MGGFCITPFVVITAIDFCALLVCRDLRSWLGLTKCDAINIIHIKANKLGYFVPFFVHTIN